MTPQETLDAARRTIVEYAAGDLDKWWYANRFVFARLQLDERKTKVAIKVELLASGVGCHACGLPFPSRRDVHLHRLDGARGYGKGNCVLMHAECHRKCHTGGTEPTDEPPGRQDPVVIKESKRYQDKPFLYWWDISPSLAELIDGLEAVDFVRKDDGERCSVPARIIKDLLLAERQTTRGTGNWGVKVMKDRPDELAFEPGAGRGEWIYLPVAWLTEADD